jgi:SAM-dependent methyltransferase
MIRYQAAAIALKAFSASPGTRKFYRWLGNRIRGAETTDLAQSYGERAVWLIAHLRALGFLDGRPRCALEVGTGWMHFYGFVLSLAGIDSVDLYDVWDNRQFERMTRSFANFDSRFDALKFTGAERERAAAKLALLRQASSFAELYPLLGFTYIVDERGELSDLSTAKYDIICSTDVLEHVYPQSIEPLIESIWRALKPGGVSLHQVGLDDHLSHYDPYASPKQYLRYGDLEWRLRFANRVQHFSRVSYDELRELFLRAGFEDVEVRANQASVPLNPAQIAPRFRNQTAESLAATRAYLVHRKPG